MIKITLSYRFSFLQKVLALCLWAFIALSSTEVVAQFAVVEDFRGGGNPDIIIGDNAILTSGNADPVNSGWLRLTPALGNKKGYAYINKSFPATLGVLMDFEYKIWRDVEDVTYSGADGLSIFLFDGTITSNDFALGGYGGSLGYAKFDSTPGLKGGYVGIGIDEYGNFANPNSSAKYGGPGERPNSVVMRGPTTTNNSANVVGGVQPTNRFLTGKTIRTSTTAPFFTYDNISVVGDRNQNAIDYNTVTPTRPNDATFYRRVQVEIQRVDLAGEYYKIIVRWKTNPNDLDFTQILEYTTQDVPPALLKIGFAGGTGGGFNYHEIRNLFVTTPGNLRVSKRADKDLLQLTAPDNILTYTIEVTNDTDFEAPNISFKDKITDAYGDDLIEGTDYNVESITTTGFVSTALPDVTTITSNEITGTLVLGARKTGRIVMVVKLLRAPQGNVLSNLANVDYPLDEDKNNNTSIVRTPVIATGVDLVLSKTVTQQCIDGSNTTLPIFTVNVSNIGSLPTVFNRLGTAGQRIAIYNTVPAGYTGYDDSATLGGFAGTVSDPQNGNITARWSKTSVVNPDGSTTYRYIARGTNTTGATETLGAGVTYPPPSPPNDYSIKYSVKPPTGVTTYNDVSTAALFTDLNYNIPNESAANQLNNNASITMNLKPAAPAVPPGTIYYCIGETAVALTATATGTNTLRWYVTPTGFASEFAIKPDTSTAGIYTYYVSQVNGNCEGPQTPISVVVLSPTQGVISGAATICAGTGTTIGSTTGGTAGTGAPAAGNTISYRWEKALGTTGDTWATTPGSSATLATGNLPETTRYRRYTILTTAAGKVCESPVPTNEILITVPVAGVIGSAQTYCSLSANPTMLTTITPGSPGTPTAYLWKRSLTGTGGWANVPNGADNSTSRTTQNYDPVNGQVLTYYYQRTETYGSCTVTSNVVKITINATTPTPGTIVGQTVCNGDTPTIVSGTAPGGDILSYQWYSHTATTSGGGTYTAIPGATSETYTPPAMTASTWFRRTAINGCTAPTTSTAAPVTPGVRIIVQSVPTRGSIGTAQTICYNTMPQALTSLSAGTGSQTTPTYRWESAPGTTGGTWTTIPGATSAGYNPNVLLTSSIRYRRFTVSTLPNASGGNSVCESVPTDEVVITVKAATDPKTIGPEQTICYNTSPATLTGTPGNGEGAITYRWESSTTGAAPWLPIAVNNISYTPGPLTTSTYFRRVTIATLSGACEAASPAILITVQGNMNAGGISGPANICNGISATITSSSDGTGSGTITYRWQSAAATGSFTDIPGETGPTLVTGSLISTMRYQRFTVSTQNGKACEAGPSNIVTVNVYAAVTEGGIEKTQKICYNTAPLLLTSTTDGSTGGSGTLGYKWQNSIDNGGSWQDVAGANGNSYQPPTLTATTHYRRITTSTNGCQSGPTVPVIITVVPVVNPGTITGNQVICMDTLPGSLGSLAPGTSSGATIAYRWESSANGSTGWVTIATATGLTYQPPILHKTTYYRRVTIATFTGGVATITCEGVTTPPISVTTKNCKVITNPMIYQKVKGN
ncbi:Ig-like domain-containing protein [Flavobacterium cerinum]|uniref:Ig-like domain-containing protein n=1 Tax=Flavobacterium cerinum TaxID=2502784 RepID=A0A444HBL1_9FLAO|nr:hypothetical protein [Flavobacterium cerinum]RWX00756.1 hypothetical protein EPI11_06975 [Flavobacterium cerinum]